MLGLLSAAGSLVGPIAGLIGGIGQKRAAKKINPIDATYEISPYAKNQLAMAQNLYNARSAGAGAAEQNILTNQANQVANVNRNAVDSSQALAIAAGLQGNTNQALSNLAVQESQDQMGKAGFVADAQNTLINEGDKVYQDTVRKYDNAVAAKSALQNAGQQNTFNAVQGLGGVLTQAGNGAFGNLFGGGKLNSANLKSPTLQRTKTPTIPQGRMLPGGNFNRPITLPYRP